MFNEEAFINKMVTSYLSSNKIRGFLMFKRHLLVKL